MLISPVSFAKPITNAKMSKQNSSVNKSKDLSPVNQNNLKSQNFGMKMMMYSWEQKNFPDIIGKALGTVDADKITKGQEILQKNIANWLKPYLPYYSNKTIVLEGFKSNNENVGFYISDNENPYNPQVYAEMKINEIKSADTLDNEEISRGATPMDEKLFRVLYGIMGNSELISSTFDINDYLNEFYGFNAERDIPPITIEKVEKNIQHISK